MRSISQDYGIPLGAIEILPTHNFTHRFEYYLLKDDRNPSHFISDAVSNMVHDEFLIYDKQKMREYELYIYQRLFELGAINSG